LSEPNCLGDGAVPLELLNPVRGHCIAQAVLAGSENIFLGFLII